MGYLCEALAMRANVDDDVLKELAASPLNPTSKAFLIATGQEEPE
jgi:hypothetical protein